MVNSRIVACGNSDDDKPKKGLLNERIQAIEVQLIDEHDKHLGVVLTEEALNTARERGLDLYLVQPDANPPVARILDYRRFKFDQQKKELELKRKHHIVDVKEIKMRYKIEDHDYQVKLRNAQMFLNKGDKIKVVIMLRGREMQHSNMAVELMNRFSDHLKDLAIIDREPYLEGKSVIMLLSAIPRRG